MIDYPRLLDHGVVSSSTERDWRSMDKKPASSTIDNALRLLGEAFVPGASLLMKGEIVSGSAHLIIGSWAKVAIGPVGHALVIANSYTEASTGKSLLKHFSKVADDLRGAASTADDKGGEAASEGGEAASEGGETASEGAPNSAEKDA